MSGRDIDSATLGNLEIRISAAGLTRCFIVLVAVLVALHAGVQVARFITGNDRLFGLVYMFSLGADGNVPTLYSSFALLFSALLLAAIASRAAADRGYWWVLSLAFLFLTLDESLEIHEKLFGPLRQSLHTSGLLHYAWVIPYGIGAAAFGLAYVRFLMRLPRRTAVIFVVAGLAYVGGAVGMEMIGGLLFEESGSRSAVYVLAQSVEEILEMGGIVLFIYALADYVERHCGGLTLRLGSA